MSDNANGWQYSKNHELWHSWAEEAEPRWHSEAQGVRHPPFPSRTAFEPQQDLLEPQQQQQQSPETSSISHRYPPNSYGYGPGYGSIASNAPSENAPPPFDHQPPSLSQGNATSMQFEQSAGPLTQASSNRGPYQALGQTGSAQNIPSSLIFPQSPPMPGGFSQSYVMSTGPYQDRATASSSSALSASRIDYSGQSLPTPFPTANIGNDQQEILLGLGRGAGDVAESAGFDPDILGVHSEEEENDEDDAQDGIQDAASSQLVAMQTGSVASHSSRQHSCPICGKSFRYPKDLRRHMRTHDGRREYFCQYCRKLFARLDNARRHEKTCGWKDDSG